MKGLFIILGESFRSGGQCSRIRGNVESFKGQMAATSSHLKLIHTVKNVDVFLATYTTPFDNVLLMAYKPYLVDHLLLDIPIGLSNLFHQSVGRMGDTIRNYDYIFVLRVDLFLKIKFFSLFNPCKFNTIIYPSICWYKDSCTRGGHPRVNDTMLFIPKKYFCILPSIEISHDSWMKLMENTLLTYHDLDTLLNTFHDSDSQKDYNPIYFMVSRPICLIYHSRNKFFNKHKHYFDRVKNYSIKK